MAKRVRLTSKFALQKCNKRHHDSKDRIDRLPDDILVSILSLLTMKDAAKTSVLSHRWRYLWTFITGALEFDESKLVYDMLIELLIGSVPKSLEVERRRFVDWVNQVLRSHRASTLDGFKVCFDMDDSNSCKSLIDDWLNFAIQKRVKWLELDFSCSRGYLIRGNYALNPHFFSQFDSLTSLRLNCLDVTGEAVEYFISKCPFLEVLCLIASKVLVNLKICGPSLKLMYLEISGCPYLETMEIFALDLVSFKYSGPKISIPLMNVPSLHEVSLGGLYNLFGFDNCCPLSSYLSLLTTLKLNLSIKDFTSIPKFLKLGNLKHLELRLDAMGCHSLLDCHSLLKASPSLNRLVLKLTGLADVSKQEKVKVRKLKCPYQCLKVVELVGFVGVKIDFELALHILKNSVSLEKIIIDTRWPHTTKAGWAFEDREKKLAAITRARGLETRLPPGVELVILNV